MAQHGRSHDERAQKIGLTRASKRDEEGLEAELMGQPGRSGVVPDQGLVGSHDERRASAAELEEPEPVEGGSEYAPTEKAARRERERHRIEREELGRVAAGTAGQRKEIRPDDISRDDLERAGRQADAHVGAKSDED